MRDFDLAYDRYGSIASDQAGQQLRLMSASPQKADKIVGASLGPLCANSDRTQRSKVALAPDVILGSGGTVVAALLEASRSVPVVFTMTPDPVGAGFVASLARLGGNATGFTGFEYSVGAKWLELLKEIAPHVRRVAVLRDATTPQGIGLFAVIRGMASALGLELRPIGLRDADEIERRVFNDYTLANDLDRQFGLKYEPQAA